MYINKKAIKKLKIYILVMSFVFILSFALAFSGVHFQDIAYENYLYGDDSWDVFEKNYAFSDLLLTIATILMIIGTIMVFIITGIVLCIKRFKMKDEGE